MTDQSPVDPVDIREQLAALLAAELDADVADRLQDRIDAEPWVAALADEVAEAMAAVGAVDAVEPPPGFSGRLRDALEAEVGRPIDDAGPAARRLQAAGAAAATGWAGTSGPARRGAPGSADGRRPSGAAARDLRTTRTRRLMAVAAAVAVLAVAGVGVLTSSGFLQSSDDEAAGFDTAAVEPLDSADEVGGAEAAGDADAASATGAAEGAEAPAADELQSFPAEQELLEAPVDDAPTAEGTAAEDSATSAAPAAATDDAAAADGSAAAETAASGTAPDGPALLEVGEMSGDDQTVIDVLGRHPAAESLLGTDAGSAAELALAYRDEILRAPAFGDGTQPGACLADVLDQAGEGRVPAVAARIDVPEGPSLAYTLVRARGDVLDTADVWILDLGTCDLRRVVSTGDS